MKGTRDQNHWFMKGTMNQDHWCMKGTSYHWWLKTWCFCKVPQELLYQDVVLDLIPSLINDYLFIKGTSDHDHLFMKATNNHVLRFMKGTSYHWWLKTWCFCKALQKLLSWYIVLDSIPSWINLCLFLKETCNLNHWVMKGTSDCNNWFMMGTSNRLWKGS